MRFASFGPPAAYDGGMRTSEAPPEGVSIAAVSRRLDIPVPTIRSWERRYGFPVAAEDRRSGTAGTRRGEIEQLRDLRDLITRGHSARAAVEPG